jgi:hypothetical protein
MNPSQQDRRRSAAEEFMNSLDQLSLTLKTPEETAVEAAVDQSSDRQTDIDRQADIDAEVLALEEAAADIERYIQAQRQI